MKTCLKCHSDSVVSGQFVSCEGYPAEFRLIGAPVPRLKPHWLPSDAKQANACFDCGFTWNAIEPGVLRSLVEAATRGSSPSLLGPKSNRTMKGCLICRSDRVVSGEYVSRKGEPTRFRPVGVRRLKLVFRWVSPGERTFTGCLDCGCVWNSIDPALLRSSVKENCKASIVDKYGLNGQQV